MTTPPLYAISCTNIEITHIIHQLREFNINCVVDLRSSGRSAYEFRIKPEELANVLRCNNIYYLPFGNYFDTFGQDVKDKYGRLVYRKTIKTTLFQQGIERIMKGVEKGYNIMLVDSFYDIENSLRYDLVGRRMHELNYDVRYIDNRGHVWTHNEMFNLIQAGKESKKAKREQAKQLGVNGEELAALYLINKGYRILDRNWNLYKGCELDIVAMKDNVIHFVEVKTRSSLKYGEPQEAISRKKMNHICTAIREYRWKEFHTDKPYMIDYISIVYRNENDYDLQHVENISYTITKRY